MIVRIAWESAYAYSTFVRQVHNELRVCPADGHGQRLLSWDLHVRPEARLFDLVDAFGNRYHHFDLLKPVHRLVIGVDAEVETALAPIPEPALSPLMCRLFTARTDRSPFDERIAALADDAGPPDAPPLELAEALTSLIASRFTYEVGTTRVEDTALDLLRVGRGVCQDFTHLMLAALRMRGVPARYVSGYLAPREGETMSEATHAWVQVYADGAWHGFDPSNNTPQDELFVVTAVGRDYDDVPPVRGSYRGLAEQAWRATVVVQSQQSQQSQQSEQSQQGQQAQQQ